MSRAGPNGMVSQILRLGIGRGGAKILSFLSFLLVARALGPSGFGALTFALSLGALLAFIPNMGVDPLFSREVSSGRAEGRELLGLALTLKGIGGGIFGIVFLTVLLTTAPEAIGGIGAGAISAAMILLAITETWKVALITGGRAGLSALVELLAPCVFLSLTLVVGRAGATVSTAALSFLAGQAVGATSGFLVVARTLGMPRRPTEATAYLRIFRMTLPLMLIWFLSDLYLRIDMTILYYLRGSGETGFYGASYRLVDGVYSAAMVVSAVALPRMSAAWARGVTEWRREWRGACRAVLLIVVPFGAVLLGAAGGLIRLLYGAEFAGAIPSLRLLGPATVVLCLGYVYAAALTSIGLVWTQFWITVASLLGNVVLNLVLIPRFGAAGAAVATLVSGAGYVGLAHWSLRRPVGGPVIKGTVGPLPMAGSAE